MAKILTSDFIKPYISEKKRHAAYEDTKKIAADLRIHADGENGGDLIEERRPSESEHIKKYREKIFVAITEPVISKIITSLGKIRRSSDWSIKYEQPPAKIVAEETPEEYFEKKYPTFGSLTKWVFDVLLKQYLTDPNSIILVLSDSPKDNTSYRKPYTIIFNSEDVYDFIDGQYAVLHSTDKCEYTNSAGKKQYNGDVIYACDTEVIQRWEQINDKGDMGLALEYKHGIGELPAFKAGGILSKAKDKIFVYKSRINATIPHLKEAVREYSDLQAEVVQHIHSEKWTYQTQKCTTCTGTGRRMHKGQPVTCSDCKGQGTLPTTPYSAVVLNVPKIGEPTIPGGVPLGYVQKQTDIVKIQDERVDRHCYKALASINMEFLAQTPLSQSGDAKNVDRDELNTFVDSIAEDLVSRMDRIYWLGVNMRYKEVVQTQAELKKLVPSVAVPQNYDLLSASYLLQELEKAKSSKLNPVTLVAMEVEYANKKFNNNTLVRDTLRTVLELDPFPGIPEGDKMSQLQNGGISEEDYVISSNIYSFVVKAVSEDKEFLSKKFSEKKKVIAKYAQDVIKLNKAASAILDPTIDPNGGGN